MPASDKLKQLSEDIQGMMQDMYQNPGATSFSDCFDSMKQGEADGAVNEAIDNCKQLMLMCYQMCCNIQNDSTIEDPIGACQNCVGECYDLCCQVCDDCVSNMGEQESPAEDQAEPGEEPGESDGGTSMGDMMQNMSKEQSFIQKIKSLLSKARTMKTEGGIKFPASDFLYVPDPQTPSTWKLRVAEGRPGNITAAQLGRAAAALGPKGYMGNKVQMPASAKASAKRKLLGLYHKINAEPPAYIGKEISEPSMVFWQKEDGTYRWFATYSNNYRDEDRPSEIIAAQSHENFVKEVDSGQLPYPQLWHWHVPGTQWGQADWLAFDKETGMAMAAGYILPGHEKEAEAVAQREDLGVSHGMPPESIRRDPNEQSVIIRHITREISDLPLSAAANKLTSFSVFNEEKAMGIPDVKKEYLKQLGYTDDQIQQIEEGNVAKAQKAAELNLESKEESVVETPAVETPVVEAPVAETPAVEYMTKESFDSQMAALVKSVSDSNALVAQALQAITTRLDTVEEKSKEITNPIPSASIAALISQNLTATKAKEAQVRANSELAKSGPVETPAESAGAIQTGNPILDSIFAGIVK